MVRRPLAWAVLVGVCARHGPAPKPVRDDASARCVARKHCGESKASAGGAVHVMSTRAGWGPHENYYHFMFGRLVPLFHWLAAESSMVAPEDLVIVNDADATPRELWTPYILESLVAPRACGRAPRIMHLAPSFNETAILAGLRAADLPVDNVKLHAFKVGMDTSLRARRAGTRERRPSSSPAHRRYGCGSLNPAAKGVLAEQIDHARVFGRDACGCCARRPGGPLVVAVLDRNAGQRFTKGGPRTIPNIGNVTAALRAAAPRWEASLGAPVDVRTVEFQAMSHCDQWCAADAATVVVGQHGAGLANMAFLRAKDAGLVEIAPASVAFKTIFHCLAGLRGSHYGKVSQSSTTADVDVDDVVAAVDRTLRAAAASADVNATERYPESRLSPHMRLHCQKSGGGVRFTGWRRRIAC